jgi:glycosyltransferase involved in cell wall biosynthesis
MPAYNAGKYIKQTINSLLNQEYNNFELLIYNDASTDNTNSEIAQFNDSRIVVFEGKVNIGVSAARNFLLSKAIGEFISFFDSDDISVNNKFTYSISYLNKKSEIDLIGSKTHFINESSKKILFIKTFESISSDDIKADLLFNNTFSTSTIVFRKKILSSIKFDNNISIAEDYLMFTQLSEKIKMENINKKLVKYRVNKTSLMFKNKDSLKSSLDKIHNILLTNLGIIATPELIEIHNKFIYSNNLSLNYLDSNLKLYQIILKNNDVNHIYKQKSLLNAIRKNWFLKCLYCSKSHGISSLTYYFFRFPYHNYSIIVNGIFLLLYYLKKSLKP